MHSFTLPSLALAALAALPSVSAHGYVSGIVSGGKWYPGSNPNWYYLSAKPATAGWYALNQDNGFVSPSSYGSSDIACHKSATPGSTTVPVTAGSTIQLQWNTWPDSHHGPVMDYLAACPAAGCTKASAGTLNFAKIDQGGLISGSNTGTWASDQLIANNFTWAVTIPSSVKTGQYVLRTEILALHSATQTNGAQNYPQCVNLAVTGSGTAVPSGEVATKFYSASDPGIVFNLYTTFSSYPIPGPSVWSAAAKRASKKIAKAFSG